MEKKFKEIYKIIEKFNIHNNNRIFSDEEIQEEIENINEINEIETRLDNTLNKINILKDEENRALLSELVQLHLVISDIEWQYDQIHEMLRKVLTSIEIEEE